MVSNNKIGRSESDDNKTNLSNPSASKKSIGAGYLISKDAKRGSGNTKKSVKAIRSSYYLTSSAKKTFNLLQYAFTQMPIFQHFDPELYIQIKTNASDYAIGRILS